MKAATITLTGVDERVPVSGLHLLAGWPAAEVGFLYRATAGGGQRYPSRDWLAKAMASISGRGALHVCGREARAQLLAGELGDLTTHAARIQVNGTLEVDEVESLCRQYRHVITQHNTANSHLLQVAAPNHSLLVDSSGGSGRLPDRWERPDTPKSVGFAGGLSGDNLVAQLEGIEQVASGSWWVDMESSLRDEEDWFDLSAASQVLRLFHGYRLRIR